MIEQLFISSVQKELQEERFAIRDFVHGNDLLRHFFRAFLFEDLPPVDQLSRPHPSVPRNRLLCEPGTMGT